MKIIIYLFDENAIETSKKFNTFELMKVFSKTINMIF